jgi:Protein of unknown function (DUF3712)
MEIQSDIAKAPLNITDDDVFSEVVSALMFGSKKVKLTIDAEVDVKIAIALGDFAFQRLPAGGEIEVKPFGGGFGSLSPKVSDLAILDTSATTISLQAAVAFDNPTEYSALLKFASVNILSNDTVLGHVTVNDATVVPGRNEKVIVNALWDPHSSVNGPKVGVDLLSRWISGENTTLTFKTYEGTVPSNPALGRALSGFEVTIPTPRLSGPSKPGNGDGDKDGDNKPHFIEEATVVPTLLELLSSI